MTTFNTKRVIIICNGQLGFHKLYTKWVLRVGSTVKTPKISAEYILRYDWGIYRKKINGNQQRDDTWVYVYDSEGSIQLIK